MNKKIIHMLTKREDEPHYLCNSLCSVIKIKITTNKRKVTCKNCLTTMKKAEEWK